MIEDELLKWRFKHGSKDALRRIYEKYLNHLLTFAMALLNDAGRAEDVVHDVFVSFAGSAKDFKLGGNLKSYLTTCVINRARDRIRANRRGPIQLDAAESVSSNLNGPDHVIISSEESRKLNHALAQLPDEQRQVIALHLKGEMTFSQIAKLHNVSVNTVQGRYRYGLNKLRSVLNGEVEK
ncbi:MAG: sigma-70 family RNA polymerase sigma factor [Sedimentisphaerales bacterium]|nr:sigma-70 family RNA polymerase sigma factor [Sedimentisphaerales bacterium]